MLTIADLQKEYLLVKAKLRLLKKEPSLTTQLTSKSFHTTMMSIANVPIHKSA